MKAAELADWRRRQGFTVNGAAEHLGIGRTSLMKYEAGAPIPPYVEKLIVAQAEVVRLTALFYPIPIGDAAEREAAMRSAKLDSERLDFLDRASARLNAKYGTTYRWRLIMNHNVNRLMIGDFAVDLQDAEARGLPTCRDAIDEKMREVHRDSVVARARPGGTDG